MFEIQLGSQWERGSVSFLSALNQSFCLCVVGKEGKYLHEIFDSSINIDMREISWGLWEADRFYNLPTELQTRLHKQPSNNILTIKQIICMCVNIYMVV